MTTDPTFSWLAEGFHCAPSENGLKTVLKTVDWRCNATANDGLSATAYGTVALANPDPSAFEAYDGLTEVEVVGWMKDALGNDDVARIEANLAGEITKRRNPPIVTMAPPWVAASAP